MSPSRAAPGTDPRRVVAILGGVGPQETDRALAVVDLIGVRLQAGQAVINTRNRVALARQAEHRGVDAVLAALGPPTTMNPHQQGVIGVGFLGNIQVQLQRHPVDLRVLDVPDRLDALGRFSAPARPLRRPLP